MPNFSGKWNLQGQLQGIKQGDWTGLPYNRYNLYATGRNTVNFSGKIGDDSAIDRSSPVQVGAQAFWAFPLNGSVGTYHSAHISNDGELYTWGRGSDGRTGQNATDATSSPTQVGALTDWSKLSSGDTGSVAIKTDGTLWAWGQNSFGNLGINNRVDASSPVQIGALTNWSDVSQGISHCLAIKTDGSWWAWGRNYSGAWAKMTKLIDPPLFKSVH